MSDSNKEDGATVSCEETKPLKRADSKIPSGGLARLQARRRDFLRDASSLDLLHELTARFESGDPYPSSDEALAIGKLLKDHLLNLTDVHNNRFSQKRLRDYYYAFLRPHSKVRPPIENATWVEIGCGSLNPAGFLFLVLMLGAKRGIAVDLDPIQAPALAWKALAETAAMMLVDPKSILEWDEVDPHDLLRHLSSFDLAKLRAGDEGGLDPERLMFLHEHAESISLLDSMADVVISNSFLEHVPDIDLVISQFARITKPGGMGVHNVDGKDHRTYVNPDTHALAFLEIPDTSPLVEGCNRIRPLALPAIFERHGFEVLEEEVWERTDVTEGMRSRFVEPFRSMSQEHLEALSGQVVVRRR